MGRRLWLWGPAVACAAAIFWLSHQPVLPAPPGNDKLAHFVAFGTLSALIARGAWFDTRWSSGLVYAAAALLGTLYGLSDEVHQTFVPGRDASVADVVADAAGALFGPLAWILGCRMASRFTPRVLRDTRAECTTRAPLPSPSPSEPGS